MAATNAKSTANEMRAQLEKLKEVRDELRVQAHLGGIEAKEAWKRIEPHFDALVAEAAEAGQITMRAAVGVFQGLKSFVAEVQKEHRDEKAKREAHS